MDQIILKEKVFKKILDEEIIKNRVSQLSDQINTDYKNEDNVIFLVILNGAFIFAADLLRGINFNPVVSFVKLTSYSGMDNNKVKCLLGINESLTNKNIIILDDIIDSGNTIKYMYDIINFYKPISVKTVTLLLKNKIYKEHIPVNYTGFNIDNGFVIGYGLDYHGLGRNFRSIYQIK